MATKSLGSRARPRAGTRRRNGLPSRLTVSALVGLGLLLGLSLQPQPVDAQDTQRAEVALNVQSSMDPCPDRGEVQGLDPQGDGFLAVRTGPSTEREQVDELHNGDVVMLCDYQNGWHRVVYPGEGQEAAACLRRSRQLPEPGSVTGPCRSGWVHGNWVRWIWR